MNRGQARALEGVAAALLVVGAVVFALQSAVVTPLAASTTNQFLEDRQGTLASDTLDTAAAAGELRGTVRYWNLTSRTFDGARREGYVGGPPTAFGDTLRGALGDRRVAYNVYVTYRAGNSSHATRGLVYQGTPPDTATAATTVVTLYDDDTLTAPANPNVTLGGTDGFYAPDAVSGPVYNVVEIRVVVWRA
ncbi:DUF7288 family protein [Halosegnis marinus]|uniref:Type IV pilin n=1 Tax=Halosegnis marinus TaxID=3034023 RepID=A0ABD5ZM13_9EURY|nr:hypothetical protein [Halosegnis sp. DT85]